MEDSSSCLFLFTSSTAIRNKKSIQNFCACLSKIDNLHSLKSTRKMATVTNQDRVISVLGNK
jgi:hypothetical protein